MLRIAVVLLLISTQAMAESIRWIEPDWGTVEIKKAHCVDTAFIAVDAFRMFESGVGRNEAIGSLINPTLLKHPQYRAELPMIIGLLQDRYAGINNYTSESIWDIVYKPCRRAIGTDHKYVIK